MTTTTTKFDQLKAKQQLEQQVEGPKAKFDCKSELQNWQASWSDEKKAWCCKAEGIGCKPSSPSANKEGSAPPSGTTMKAYDVPAIGSAAAEAKFQELVKEEKHKNKKKDEENDQAEEEVMEKAMREVDAKVEKATQAAAQQFLDSTAAQAKTAALAKPTPPCAPGPPNNPPPVIRGVVPVAPPVQARPPPGMMPPPPPVLVRPPPGMMPPPPGIAGPPPAGCKADNAPRGGPALLLPPPRPMAIGPMGPVRDGPMGPPPGRGPGGPDSRGPGGPDSRGPGGPDSRGPGRPDNRGPGPDSQGPGGPAKVVVLIPNGGGGPALPMGIPGPIGGNMRKDGPPLGFKKVDNRPQL